MRRQPSHIDQRKIVSRLTESAYEPELVILTGEQVAPIVVLLPATLFMQLFLFPSIRLYARAGRLHGK